MNIEQNFVNNLSNANQSEDKKVRDETTPLLNSEDGILAKQLPDWDLLPPTVFVRRRKAKK